MNAEDLSKGRAEYILSPSNRTLSHVRKLRKKHVRDEEGLLVLEGANLLEEAIRRHIPLTDVLIAEDAKADGSDILLMNADYIIEPSPERIMEELLPKVLCMKLYTVLLDTNAAEHAARTMAMQIATDNANDLLQELTLIYNKSRQQAITNELLDIVGGSMA